MEGTRLPDDVVLGMVARQLSNATGTTWSVEAEMAKGPGTVGVVIGKEHPDSPDHPGHIDLDFILNIDRPEDTTISDCVTGHGSTVEEAVDFAISLWLDTTCSALLEFLAQDGSFGTHVYGDDRGGFPGWHAIYGGISGYGADDHAQAILKWFVDNPLLPRLAPTLNGTFERDYLIGIKMLLGGANGEGIAEVRVNGMHHAVASQALASLDWPRPPIGGVFRTFALLVHKVGIDDPFNS